MSGYLQFEFLQSFYQIFQLVFHKVFQLGSKPSSKMEVETLNCKDTEYISGTPPSLLQILLVVQ